MRKVIENPLLNTTLESLSDVEGGLKELLGDEVAVRKIIEAVKKHQRMSSSFLAHKYGFNSYTANRIMRVIRDVQD